MSLASQMDHTCLKWNAKRSDIEKVCEEAIRYGFFSVCVPPIWVETAHKQLSSYSTQLCSVVGFPAGFHLRDSKVEEAKMLKDRGANEIDMVVNLSAVVESNEILAVEEIEAVMRAIDPLKLKVIIECPLLTPAEIQRASQYISKAGAAFVKTATGLHPDGAKVKDVELIRREVGALMGIKASGGIKTYAQARALIEAGATRIGSSASVAIIEEEQKISA